MRTPPIVLLALISIGSTACGGGGSDAKAASGDDPASAATADSASDKAADASAAGDKPAADADATGAASAGPDVAPGATAKDEAALVLELNYMMKGGGPVDPATTAALKKAAAERLAKSTKMAGPESKVNNPRRVMVTVLVEAPTDSKKGLNVKMGLVGVEAAGRCPLFDLDQNFTMSGAKTDSAADVLQLRSAAISALLDKLEVTAPTLKPTANCSTYKDKK